MAKTGWTRLRILPLLAAGAGLLPIGASDNLRAAPQPRSHGDEPHPAAGRMLSPDRPRGQDVVVSRDGAVFVTGVFRGEVDFDPGPRADLRRAQDGLDVFVTKYRSDGSYAWTRTFGGAGDDDSDGIEVSPGGEVTLHLASPGGASVRTFHDHDGDRRRPVAARLPASRQG